MCGRSITLVSLSSTVVKKFQKEPLNLGVNAQAQGWKNFANRLVKRKPVTGKPV